MAASATVSQLPQSRNLLAPRHGVLTLNGYGISVNMDRGHLIVKDGIGRVRSEGRFARVGHGLRRLVVIGSDGFVSLAALRWLADQDATFVMLERDGSVLAVIGPVRPSDARLIQPRLSGLTIPAIMSALNVCESYAADIRRGKRRPHALHWEKLERLAGVSRDRRI